MPELPLMSRAELKEALAKHYREWSLQEGISTSPTNPPLRWEQLSVERRQNWYKRVDFIMGFLSRYFRSDFK